MARARDKQRSHDPHKLGPRIEFRGRYATADMRPWDGQRYTPLRNPRHPLWPGGGERTQEEDVAREWAWAYVRLAQDESRRTNLGLGPRPKALQQKAGEWLDHRERTVAYATWSNSQWAVRHLIEYMGSGARTDQITTERVQGLFDELIADGYAPSTLVTMCANLSAFCDWLGHGSANAARGVVLPDPGKSDVVPPTDEEIEMLREAASKLDGERGTLPSLRLAVETALAMGPRQQELFALDWCGVRPQERTVRITRQLAKRGGGFTPLKGKQARTALVLPEWWRFYTPGRSGIVLSDGEGRIVPPGGTTQREMIDNVLERAGLKAPMRGWHWLRHGYARLCLERYDVRLEELRQFLGHQSISVTDQIYGHLAEHAAARNARQRIYVSEDEGPPVLRVVK